VVCASLLTSEAEEKKFLIEDWLEDLEELDALEERACGVPRCLEEVARC
jgi:hypothetical protein